MALFKTPSTTSQPETLGVSTLDSLTYDLSTSWGLATVVWTSRSGDQDIALYRLIDPYALPQSHQAFPRRSRRLRRATILTWQSAGSGILQSSSNLRRRDHGRYSSGPHIHASLNISNDQFADNRNATRIQLSCYHQADCGVGDSLIPL